MQDKHGSGNGTAEEDFAVAEDTFVCENAMGIFFDPINNILVTARPKRSA